MQKIFIIFVVIILSSTISTAQMKMRNLQTITDEPDDSFAIRLTKERGVASIPTSPFLYTATAPRVLRFCFAKKDETLRLAAERLAGL